MSSKSRVEATGGRSRAGAGWGTLRAAAAAVFLLGCSVACAGSLAAQEEQDWPQQRERLLAQIRHPPAGLEPVTGRRVLEAIGAVPRHEFVPPELRDRAYENRPLPIGHGQTISQPYVVARMTELARVRPGDRVLEVGTGSGYQAAVLAEITDSVYSIEIIGSLARTARARLQRLGYGSVRVRHGDGYRGWPERAPFDAIVVTAAPEEVPPPLIDQLARGGRMVIPVGGQAFGQTLTVLEKTGEGEVERREVSSVRFAPFLRDTAGTPGDTAPGGEP